jgi:hypothetical protein
MGNKKDSGVTQSPRCFFFPTLVLPRSGVGSVFSDLLNRSPPSRNFLDRKLKKLCHKWYGELLKT